MIKHSAKAASFCGVSESLFLVCAVQVCELGVMNTPCSSTALCMLGVAQLAQSDSDTGSEIGQAALANACLSFQGSIMLEGLPLTGNPPEQLTSKRTLQVHIFQSIVLPSNVLV